MKKFEYKIIMGEVDVSIDDQLILNEEGKNGWELVNFWLGKTTGHGIGAKRHFYIMKREIKNKRKQNE